VTDWPGKGTEGETLTLSKNSMENYLILLLLSFCKVEGNEGGLYAYRSHTTV
jgi:hypothetical protein